MIFENYSTRTRISFMASIKSLNGNIFEIKLEDLNLQRSESMSETLKIISLYVDALVYRSRSHDSQIIAKKLMKVPVINALSDLEHPCQALSDLFSISEHFNTLNNLNITWFGDINNVIISFSKCLKFIPNSKLNIFTTKAVFKEKSYLLPQLKNVSIFHKIDNKILKESNCIMTDVYTSMNDKKKSDKNKGLIEFQVNNELMRRANSNAIFMHCLPVGRGEEVTNEVIDGKQSVVWRQALNRVHAQKSIIKWCLD